MNLTNLCLKTLPSIINIINMITPQAALLDKMQYDLSMVATTGSIQSRPPCTGGQLIERSIAIKNNRMQPCYNSVLQNVCYMFQAMKVHDYVLGYSKQELWYNVTSICMYIYIYIYDGSSKCVIFKGLL